MVINLSLFSGPSRRYRMGRSPSLHRHPGTYSALYNISLYKLMWKSCNVICKAICDDRPKPSLNARPLRFAQVHRGPLVHFWTARPLAHNNKHILPLYNYYIIGTPHVQYFFWRGMPAYLKIISPIEKNNSPITLNINNLSHNIKYESIFKNKINTQELIFGFKYFNLKSLYWEFISENLNKI